MVLKEPALLDHAKNLRSEEFSCTLLGNTYAQLCRRHEQGLDVSLTVLEGFSPEEASSLGEEFARRELCQCIKREAEEYILDKAAAMNVLLSADVSLSDSEIPVPAAVTVYTSADPSTREVLSQFLSEDLGISKENQLWMEMSSIKK